MDAELSKENPHPEKAIEKSDQSDPDRNSEIPEGHSAHNVGSHRVVFPGEPYNVQLPLMERVLRALNAHSNALIEAPTGVGKTIALLCAAMQWLEDYNLNRQARFLQALLPEKEGKPVLQDPPGEDNSIALRNSLWSFSCTSPVKRSVEFQPRQVKSATMLASTSSGKKSSRNPNSLHDPDMQASGKKMKITELPPGGFLNTDNNEGIVHQVRAEEQSSNPDFAEPRSRIFYATRTHSQIGQVVSELKRTKYKPKITILAARRHCCVHPRVSRLADVDGGCKNLRKNKAQLGCKYYINTLKMKSENYWPIEDIEDLGTSCKERGLCPYYLMKRRLPEAELVLSPYNYLIQPSIREVFNLKLDEAGIIFDEGHNIEDISREAASFETDLEAVNLSGQSFEKKAEYYERFDSSKATDCWTIHRAFEGLSGLLNQYCQTGVRNTVLKKVDNGKYEVVYESFAAVRLLEEAGIGSVHLVSLRQAFDRIRELEDPQDDDLDHEAIEEENNKEPDVSVALALLEQLIAVLDMMYKGPAEFTEAYRLCVKRILPNGERKSSRKGSLIPEEIHFTLMCLNAAVAFSQISKKCRSVILTSGTLSPMSSFASELGVEFKFILESPHVVDMEKQVWAGVCSVDPANHPITCTYNEMQKLESLDSIGNILLAWCRVVPDGILVFLPSFRVLNALIERWMYTGLYHALTEVKTVFQESRGGTDSFDELMNSYYQAIDDGYGAVYFGVCRGKASEGINFADAYARSVVMVGIPYPSFMDVKIKSKKEYNTKWSNRLGLVRGDVWYNQQAFRALNQGIGRCIRHKKDYGAILLLDHRYTGVDKLSFISRWVRSRVQAFSVFDHMASSVGQFFMQNQEIAPKIQQNRKPKKRNPPPVGIEKPRKVRLQQPTLDQFQQRRAVRPMIPLQPILPERKETLPGFADLLDETLKGDIALFVEFLVKAEIFQVPEQQAEAEDAAKRNIMDCINLALKSVSDVEAYLADWLNAVPTGIAALLKLKNIQSKFNIDDGILEGRQLSANHDLKTCLEELKKLYLERIGPFKDEENEVYEILSD